MSWPLPPQYKITTVYGKRGSYWSCNQDSNGNGIHTGVDFGAPVGTPVYATIAGDVRHRDYGRAFGRHQVAISPDPGQPFANGEVFYAHMRTRASDGTRVKPGDWIGEVGAEGNVSGPHLHYEFHPNNKNVWNCNAHADPKPTLGSSQNDGPLHTYNIYTSKLGFGEPSNGDEYSDTIKELQHRLNQVSLIGGETLVVSGRYEERTDKEVRLWQEQVCGDRPDPTGFSYLGPSQTKKMFDTGYTIHESGLPAIANAQPEGGPPPLDNTDPGNNLSSWGQKFVNAAEKVDSLVFYEDDWDSDSIAGNGNWNPTHVLLHHTAGTNSLSWITYGGEWQPVRLANLLINRDGTMHVCSARKTYHAGGGGPLGTVPKDEMNSYSIGIEIESMGTSQDLTTAQITTVKQFTREWLRQIGKDTRVVYNHKDWRSSKTDTLYPIEWWRTQIEPEPIVDPPPEIIDPPPVIVDPPPVIIPEPPRTVTFPLGIQYHYSGKPDGAFTFKDSYKRLDVKSWAPKKDGLTFGMLYANVDGEGEFRTRLIRENPDDPTAFQTHYAKAGDNYLLTHVWFESGEGGRPLHYEFSSVDATTHTVTTRYAKFVTIPWEVSVVIATAVAATSAVTDGIKKLSSWLSSTTIK